MSSASYNQSKYPDEKSSANFAFVSECFFRCFDFPGEDFVKFMPWKAPLSRKDILHKQTTKSKVSLCCRIAMTKTGGSIIVDRRSNKLVS